MRLDLSGNTMTAEAAPALAQALRGQPGLRALNLNDAGLGDDGVAAIAEVRWALGFRFPEFRAFARSTSMTRGWATRAWRPLRRFAGPSCRNVGVG